jgi:hypothetical protein
VATFGRTDNGYTPDANLFANPGFEIGEGDGWDADSPYPDIISSPVRTGSKAAKMYPGGLVYQELTVTPGEEMTISCWTASTDGGRLVLAVWDVTHGWDGLVWTRTENILPLTASFQKFSASFVVPTGCTTIAAGFSASDDVVGRPTIDDVYVGPYEPPEPGENLVRNPGFEILGEIDVFGGWEDSDPDATATVETSLVRTGSRACRMTGDTGYVFHPIPVVPDMDLVMEYWAASTGSARSRANIWTGDWAGILEERSPAETPLNGTYQKFSYPFTVPAGCTEILVATQHYSGDPVIVDDVFVGIPAEESYPGGVLKRWDGSAWVPATLKVWNGSAWVAKPLHRWDGSNWLEVETGV